MRPSTSLVSDATVASGGFAPRRFAMQVLLPLGALMGSALATLLLIEVWSAREQNRLAAEASQRLAESGLAVLRGDLAAHAFSNGTWDDAFVNLHGRFDGQWADDNIGSFATGHLGLSMAFVLDPEDRSVYGIADGTRTAEPIDRLVGRGLAGLIQAARLEPDDKAAAALVDLGGRPAIAAAARIQRHTENEPPDKASSLLVLVDLIDETMLADMARTYFLTDLRVVVDPTESLGAGLPIVVDAGSAIGALTWAPDRPGDAVLKRALPILLGMTLAIATLTPLVLRHARAAAAAIGEAQQIALHDPLTGLGNRLLLHDRLDRALGRLGRHDGAVAVLYLDLDRFKAVNDRLGHAAGDRLLVATARRLEALTRETDTVARLGGDEFVIVQEEIADASASIALADRFLQSLQQQLAETPEALRIGVSIGIAVSRDPATPAAELLRCADKALYTAKSAGRGRWHLDCAAGDGRLDVPARVNSTLAGAIP